MRGVQGGARSPSRRARALGEMRLALLDVGGEATRASPSPMTTAAVDSRPGTRKTSARVRWRMGILPSVSNCEVRPPHVWWVCPSAPASPSRVCGESELVRAMLVHVIAMTATPGARDRIPHQWHTGALESSQCPASEDHGGESIEVQRSTGQCRHAARPARIGPGRDRHRRRPGAIGMANTRPSGCSGTTRRELLGPAGRNPLAGGPARGVTSGIANATTGASTRPWESTSAWPRGVATAARLPVEISLSPVSTPDGVLVISHPWHDRTAAGRGDPDPQ
jgi:hypothetical protein